MVTCRADADEPPKCSNTTVSCSVLCTNSAEHLGSVSFPERGLLYFPKLDLTSSHKHTHIQGKKIISVTLTFTVSSQNCGKGHSTHITLCKFCPNSLQHYCETAKRSNLATGMQMNTRITQASRNIIIY